MGKIHEGLVGGLSGKVGPVVGAILRGQPILRMKPKKSTKPPKPSQIAQRSKFGIATKFFRALKFLVDVGYQSKTGKMSAVNAAVKDFLNNAITGEAPNFVIDYEKITLSTGVLPEQVVKVLPPVADTELFFTWNPKDLIGSEADMYANDLFTVIMYDPLKEKFIIAKGGAKRSDGKYDIQLPYYYAGVKIHIWTVFFSPDRLSVSNSYYVGSVIPLS